MASIGTVCGSSLHHLEIPTVVPSSSGKFKPVQIRLRVKREYGHIQPASGGQDFESHLGIVAQYLHESLPHLIFTDRRRHSFAKVFMGHGYLHIQQFGRAEKSV